jgi:hypothetical protein
MALEEKVTDEAGIALLRKIQGAAEATDRPEALLRLAEAYAWVVAPRQPHGGQVEVRSES